MPLTDPAAITAIRDLMQWHRDQVEYLKTVQEAKQPVSIDYGDGTEMTLDKEQSKSFRLGLYMALEFLGDLPLDLAPEDAQEVH